ncbi:MAG: hypothetical protein OXU36_05575 [Candidatus Poribacteria bacterium]|nr:hypothetical protein [Candidatus Poribacteria bacterium]
MHQQGLTRTGNIAVGVYITASDIGFPDSIEDLTTILQTLNSEQVLIILSGINCLIQHSENSSVTEMAFQQAFCSRILREQIADKNPTGRFIFGRQPTLRLLTEVACLFDAHSKSDMNQTEVKNKLARSYLIANGLSAEDKRNSQNDLEIEEENQAAVRRSVMVDFIPLVEYRIHLLSSRSNGEFLVRTHELFHRLEKVNSNIDANDLFYQATGLTLRNYYHLIALIVSKYLTLSLEKILEGEESLFIDFKGSPDLKSLYDKLLPHTCISVNTLAAETEKSPSLANEFRLWRQYPLVRLSEDRIICVDISFLLDKLQTGVFWIIRDQLEKLKKGDGQKIIGLWGDVFEDYAASIIKRGINSQKPSMERCILNPKYIGKGVDECTDIVVCSDDTLILLECKAPLLSARARFSGDFNKLRQELQTKLVGTETKEGRKKPKGVGQLWHAIQTLGHTNKKERRKIEGIDISNVKKIYPVLVLSDRVFGAPCMNWFLNSEFQRFVKRNDLKKHLEIMPLTVLTIEHLEELEPWLNDTPFYTHLDRWLEQFNQKDVRGFGDYTYSLHEHKPRGNQFMNQRFEEIKDEAYEYLSSQGSDS